MQTKIYKAKESENVLYIMRGLPGSGKTTLAKHLGGLIFSTDDYFMKNGKYEHNQEKLKEAHLWNQARTEKALKDKEPIIIIDNTHILAWEIRPYAELGIKYNYNISLVEPDNPQGMNISKIAKTNKHKVPSEIIEKMKCLYQVGLDLEFILQAEEPKNN